MTGEQRRSQAWMADALCTEVGGDVFHASTGENDIVRAAKRICAACPVAAECLEYALTNHEDDGVWGGATPRQRKSIARARRAA